MIDRTEVSSGVPIKFSTAGIGGPMLGWDVCLSIYTQIMDPTRKWTSYCRGTGLSIDGKLVILVEFDKKLLPHLKGSYRILAPNNLLLMKLKRQTKCQEYWRHSFGPDD